MTSLRASCWLLCVCSQFFSIFQAPSFGSGSSVCLRLETRQREALILFPPTTVWVRHDSTTGVGLRHTMNACWTFCLYLLDWSYCLNLHLHTVCSLLTSGCMVKYVNRFLRDRMQNIFRRRTHVNNSMSLNQCSMFDSLVQHISLVWHSSALLQLCFSHIFA